MKVALSFLACLLVANAAVLPQKGLGVTTTEINRLIKDAALKAQSMIKSMEPLKAGNVKIPVTIEGLDVKATDVKVWLGETLAFSQSSSLTNEELEVSVAIVQKEFRIEAGVEIKGTSQGKQLNQQGEIKVVMSPLGQKSTFKAELTPKSVTVVDIHSEEEIKVVSVQITGIDIDGVPKSDLESAMAEGIKDLFVKTAEMNEKQRPKTIAKINELIGGLSLQQIYDALRRLV